MTKQEKRAYFEAIQARYRRASKSRKTTILNKFGEVRGYPNGWQPLMQACNLKDMSGC